MFVGSLGIRQGLRQAVTEMQAEQNYDVSLDFAQPYAQARLREIALSVDGVEHAEAWGVSSGRLRLETGYSGSLVLIGVPADSALTRPGAVAGRWLQPGDVFALFGNAEFFELAAGAQVGAQAPMQVGGSERDWRLVGVGARGFAPVAYTDAASFAEAAGWQDAANRLVVRTALHSPAYQQQVQTDLLARFGGEGLAIANTHTTTELKQISAAQLDILVILLLVMAVLIAAVGGLGLAIGLALSVLERTREIGVLRSLGAAGAALRRIVLGEAMAIAVASWCAAVLLSLPLSAWLGDALGQALLARDLPQVFSVSGALLWLALAALTAAAASMIPARHATRITIRAAISYTG